MFSYTGDMIVASASISNRELKLCDVGRVDAGLWRGISNRELKLGPTTKIKGVPKKGISNRELKRYYFRCIWIFTYD